MTTTERLPGKKQLHQLGWVDDGNPLNQEAFAALRDRGWVGGSPEDPNLTPLGRKVLKRGETVAAFRAIPASDPILSAVRLFKCCGGFHPGREVHCAVEGCDRTERARNVGVSRMVAYFNGSGSDVVREAEEYRMHHILQHRRGEIPGTLPH